MSRTKKIDKQETSPEIAEKETENAPVYIKNRAFFISLLFILIYVLFTRFYDLGPRAFHHDEGIHAFYSWEIANKGPACYKYDPTYHGTALYFANALVYRIWGGFLHVVATDANSRFIPALCGLLIILLFINLRRIIDYRSVFFITLLGAISPTLVYFSRFLRHDIHVALCSLAIVVTFLYYWRLKNSDYISYCFAMVALSFVTKEDTYITLFIFFSFAFFKLLIEKSLNTLYSEPDIMTYLSKSYPEIIKEKRYRLFLSILFLRIITLNTLEYYLEDKVQLVKTKDFVPVDSLKRVITDIKKDISPYLHGIFVFITIYTVFFTSFFTNPSGLFRGVIGFFSYWVFNQQMAPRIPGPFYYYISKLCLYESVTLLFCLIGIGYLLIKKDRLSTAVFYSALIFIYLYSFAQDTVPVLSQKYVLYTACAIGFFYVLWGIFRMIFYLEGEGTFTAFIIYWSLSSLFIYSYAQEKVPWLMVHIVLPFTILAGMCLGKIFNEGKAYYKFAASIILIILLFFNIYSSYRLNFKMGDDPREPMVFTQTTRDVVETSHKLREIAGELKKKEQETGEKKNYTIFVDNEVSWPFVWYLRDLPVQYSLPGSAEDAQRGIAVLSSIEKSNSVESYLVGKFSGEHKKLRAWWIADMKRLYSYLWKYYEIDDNVIEGLKNKISHDKLQVITCLKGKAFTREEIISSLIKLDFDEEEIKFTADSFSKNGIEAFLGYLYRFIFFREVWNDTGSTDYMFYLKKDFSDLPVLEAKPLSGYNVAQERPVTMSPTICKDIVLTGNKGFGKGQFNFPRDLDIDSAGNIYVVDSLNHRIQKFSSAGSYLSSWGEQGSQEGRFQEPCGIEIDCSRGYVFIADTWNHRIQRFSADGQFQLSWSGEFYGPRDLAVDSNGDIYVTDTGNCLIKKYNNKGELLATIGSKGSGDGQFQEPIGIAMDKAGNILVADTWNQRVQILKPDGTFVSKFDISGWYGNSIREPYIAMASSGNCFLTDTSQSKILEYDLKGKLLSVLQTDSILGKMSAPIGIAYREEDKKLIISDITGNCIHIISLEK
ncbi:MAG TPA: TIGR03663 family protein [Candidatus Eremiobacteraeota bacterium]|nr:MAG: Serine/threonine-protein kinase PknD [bacterium ADurb.Bin363]HPZ07776.1 TIGR03663 family protein [Candidatus Eremiobacteraeota bacterium]